MKAKFPNYHQAPRKTRLVADLVRGRTVTDALTTLSFLPKRAAAPLAKLIASAAANAGKIGRERDQLIIKEISVTKGLTLKRSMPRARGSASPIRKRSSQISVRLAVK